MFKYKVERNRNRTGLNVERYRYYIHSKMHSVTISEMRNDEINNKNVIK